MHQFDSVGVLDSNLTHPLTILARFNLIVEYHNVAVMVVDAVSAKERPIVS
jgi:hypothetical protein